MHAEPNKDVFLHTCVLRIDWKIHTKERTDVTERAPRTQVRTVASQSGCPLFSCRG